ncbi:SpoIIE family protein phosphatase [Streptomyces ipomoeae]|uniref:SpoIIE family protein phosphatase n=1 Tax=Streptomyces ipomoeae TaxID=103232 RepID=UPI0006621A66|nr:SpoIIE family protein phosphatase [Streptomyces ipomoeae]MDX2696295.1 SpoIIE family protein phosphatase [Streptomyces ipomoeae]MDX2842064.1 SpoIIE family protein phosphatase [Streptomyces ipomoeae]
MVSEAALPDDGVTPDVLALAKVVARLRAEVVDLEGVAAMTAVLERAKGVVMAQAGVSADTAYELLLGRAERQRRTLMEECWITLGRVGRGPARQPVPAPGSEPAAEGQADLGPFGADQSLADTGGGTSRQTLLARVAEGLADARTPDGVAELLRTVLNAAEDVDAVMIYTMATPGSLELTGHAGVDQAVADQWSHIPPLGGVAALEAIAEERALWLEDPERDAARYVLIGGPPERWPSRAWIPLPGTRPTTTVVGILRTRRGPFDTRTRTLLRRAVRLCAGPLSVGRGADTLDLAHGGVDAVQRILDVLPGPALLLTPLRAESGVVEDYRIDAAAPESVDVAGRRGKELIGRRVLETYPTVAGTPLWDGYLDSLTTGTVFESEPFTYREVLAGVPQESTYSVRASRLGDRLVVSWIRHDTSELEARRLADMERLGNLGWASWNLMTDTITWSDQVYAIFDRDPSSGPLPLEELPRLLVPDDLPALGAALRRLLADGTAIDQHFRITTASHGVRHLRIVAEARTDVDGAPVEVHGFFQDLTAQRDAEIALKESERAVLLQRGMLQAERGLAARLQETLLPIPEQSLELAHLRVDVAYLPADSGVNVGGDWYSAIELPDDSALFVVGDVAGHGLAAVGTMAQLRFTAKGMAITGSALPDVLRRLNSLLLHTASGPYGATATMVMARYRPWDHRLTWVRAGHLPPLLVRGVEATFLTQPEGGLLGVVPDCAYAQAEIDLRPGDRLLFYTDGLVEEPGEDIEAGLWRLAEATLRLLREGRGDTLAHDLAALRPHHRDDICVLAVHVPDGS